MNALHHAPRFMLIAGEPSGDMLAGELIQALRADPGVQSFAFAPRFFGAGGQHMESAGADVVLDLCRHAMVGLSGAVWHYLTFRRHMRQLLRLAFERQPDVIIGVDFSGFNLRFARALRAMLRKAPRFFFNWKPRFVQFVSPQVWASRPGRARTMAKNLDLLLCLFPFEKEWYAKRAPSLRVEFVGHPVVDRHKATSMKTAPDTGNDRHVGRVQDVVLLPGSRVAEVNRHLPVMLEAARLLVAGVHRQKTADSGESRKLEFTLVLADERLRQIADPICRRLLPEVRVLVNDVGGALADATAAIACTGTVTLECALYGVPTVAMYKTSAINYFVARQLVSVRYLAMPNILADEELFPEFIQGRATPANLARATADFLENSDLRSSIRAKLAAVVSELGPPGAAARAAAAIASLLPNCG